MKDRKAYLKEWHSRPENKAKKRDYMRRKLADPVFLKQWRENMRAKRSDATFKAKERARERELHKLDPTKGRAKVKRWQDKMKQIPEYVMERGSYQRECYKKLRQKLFDAYGNKCACCGETERAFFEIDHVNGGGKKHLTSKSPISVYREILAAGCPPIYQLLCANCNRGRQRNGGTCPHQLKQPALRLA